MQHVIIERLSTSISKLEGAIQQAADNLSQRENVSEKIRGRVDSYKGICAMQRRFARSLKEHVENKNFQEITRIVNLINGLSAMIMDDVKVVLHSLETGSEAEGDKAYSN